LRDLSGGGIVNGGSIALVTSDGKHYVTLGTGGVIDGTGTSIGGDQTFVVGSLP
jgi:hypothetical protein